MPPNPSLQGRPRTTGGGLSSTDSPSASLLPKQGAGRTEEEEEEQQQEALQGQGEGWQSRASPLSGGIDPSLS